MSNTGIYDIESQDLIAYYLAPFVIISSRSKETVQCCKAISPTNLPVMFTLVLHITVKLECDGDTFLPFYAFQICSTKLLVHRHIWRRYAGGKMRFQDSTLRNGRLLKPHQSKSQDDTVTCAVNAPPTEQSGNIIHVSTEVEKNSWVAMCSGWKRSPVAPTWSAHLSKGVSLALWVKPSLWQSLMSEVVSR